MKKVLVVNWFKRSEMIGGTEEVGSNLAKLFNAEEISMYNASKSLGVNVGVGNYYRHCVLDRSILISDYMKFREKLKFDADVIISSDFCLAMSNLNIPMVSMSQNSYGDLANILFSLGLYDYEKFYEFGIVYPMLQRMQFQKSKQIVSVSNYMKMYTKLLGFDSEIIEHGLDFNIYKQLKDKVGLREKYGLPNKTIGLWSGGFHPVKNYHTLVELIKKFREIYWVLIFKHPVRKKTKLDNVKVFDSTTKEQNVELYNCADFVINPSVVESFGLVPLESMACNTPIISSRCGFLFDILPLNKDVRFEGGFVVNDFNSIKSFSDAVEGIKNGNFTPRDWAYKRFSYEIWKEKWMKLVSKL